MLKLWLAEVPPRGKLYLALLLAALLAAPLFVDGYLLSVLILVFYFAYLGQAWNIMMGFAGQLSLGHALYFGIGAYTSAALYVHLGVSPWFGMIAGGAFAAAIGAFIGALGFRFKIGGVYFAILTIAFAEFTRILVDHLLFVGGSGGFFLPISGRSSNDLWTLRGAPVMFYYVWLAFTVGVLILCRALLSSRLGYFWLAIREDQEAAQALGIDTFRYKIFAVMLSAALTACGGVLYAFYNNNLFPSAIFSINRSIDMLLGAIIGGVGTLMGPIVGAFILTPLGETMTALVEPLKGLGAKLDGIKQVFYGLCVVLIVVFQRRGVWPWLWRRLGLDRGEGR
ncbi:MAG: branched-chain amino acid ABC transporter permease [Alphaproteobacteria bacterium]|nr:branched-chain amino acid ABC transporter permease [Alphaproteobacteria bacterium]